MARTPSGSNALYLVLQGQGGREEPPRGHHWPNATCIWTKKMPRSNPAPPFPRVANSTGSWLRRQRSGETGPHTLCGDRSTGHSPEFKEQRLLQAQQGCAHREEEDGGTKENVLWAVAAPQRKRSSREQEETKAHQPLERREGGAVPGTELAIV